MERLSSTLNILPESSRNELKYSLKVAFMFLAIILKFQVPDINSLLGIRKKATVFDGPWSANEAGTKVGPDQLGQSGSDQLVSTRTNSDR